MRKRKIIAGSILAVVLWLTPVKSYAFTDGSGWAIFPYVVQTLYEAYRRYAQLQAMIQQGQASMEYLRWVNSGLSDITGILARLPIQDEKILGDLKNFQKAIKSIQDLYGMVPQSLEAQMQSLHDQTIAESLKVTNALKEYADGQEANANRAFQLAAEASPKGAARLAASTNAQILHTLTQLLRVNGQVLKLQSEGFALSNKESKDSVGHFNKLNGDMRASLSGFSGDMDLPRF